MSGFEPLAPACMKCAQVTGKSTCFPAPCVFFLERDKPGTVAHKVATLDRIRRGAYERVYASAIEAREGRDREDGLHAQHESAVGEGRDAPTPTSSQDSRLREMMND